MFEISNAYTLAVGNRGEIFLWPIIDWAASFMHRERRRMESIRNSLKFLPFFADIIYSRKMRSEPVEIS